VEIGVTALVPKTYIPADRQRLDVYRRITRCGSLEEVERLRQDLTDAFGQPPRQVLLVMALTEVRMLSGLFGIDSIIRQDPDVVLTLRDAARVQQALVGAPGSLRIVDDSTLYFRPPKTYLEPETLLLTLRNLLKGAYERQGTTQTPVRAATPAPPSPTKPVPAAADAKTALEKLVALRQQGVLTQEEFARAKERLGATRTRGQESTGAASVVVATKR
jgi:hypothetical protein